MKLRNSGEAISKVGFGAWAIGGVQYGEVTEADAVETLETYFALGGNFIDTARAYHESERIIGEVTARLGNRENIFIASKTKQLTAEGIHEELEATLRLLQRDYVDLYYLHAPPDSPDDMNRILDVFSDLKAAGKIRLIGASIKGPDVTQHTVDLCRQYINTGRVDALQVIYSIFRQRIAEMFTAAHEHDVAIVARTSLESGFLTGKYKPGHQFGGDDHRQRWSRARLETILSHVAEVEQIALKSPYETLSQVALRFALDTPGIDTIIPGAKNARQLRSNLSILNLPPLDEAVYKHLIQRFGNPDPIYNTGD
ncbi:MAG: aldo/keto reductase [Chloroflexota bacterium]